MVPGLLSSLLLLIILVITRNCCFLIPTQVPVIDYLPGNRVLGAEDIKLKMTKLLFTRDSLSGIGWGMKLNKTLKFSITIIHKFDVPIV